MLCMEHWLGEAVSAHRTELLAGSAAIPRSLGLRRQILVRIERASKQTPGELALAFALAKN